MNEAILTVAGAAGTDVLWLEASRADAPGAAPDGGGGGPAPGDASPWLWSVLMAAFAAAALAALALALAASFRRRLRERRDPVFLASVPEEGLIELPEAAGRGR